MIKSLAKTESFALVNKELKNLSHAYLLFSNDAVLANDMALLFAMSFFCKEKRACFECDACKQSLINKNPDLVILNKPAILVEDVEKLIDSIQFKPMNFEKKFIIINNAENINEIAQNKLLKSLEEPSDSLVFILTCTNIDKLLPTVRSRLKKIYLNLNNFDTLKQELLEKGVAEEVLNPTFTLSEMLDFSSNSEYKTCYENIKDLVCELKSTADIPKIVSKLNLNAQNKYIYLSLIEKMFNDFDHDLFSLETKEFLKRNYSAKLISKINLLLDGSYKQLKANVNVNYVYDNLFYKMLREKYLCKQ